MGCVWGPENAFRPNANRWDKMRQYDGIAVITRSRVVLLNKRGMNKLKTEMPLHALKSVDVDGEGEVTLTGRSYSDWAGDGGAGAFKLRDVQDGSARNFAGRVEETPGRPRPHRPRPLGLQHQPGRPPRRLRRTAMPVWARRSGSMPSGGNAPPCGGGMTPACRSV